MEPPHRTETQSQRDGGSHRPGEREGMSIIISLCPSLTSVWCPQLKRPTTVGAMQTESAYNRQVRVISLLNIGYCYFRKNPCVGAERHVHCTGRLHVWVLHMFVIP